MSARWLDEEVLTVTDAVASVLTPTKINRAGTTSANAIRVYNYGGDTVYYNFSGNQNPPTPPDPAAFKGVALLAGGAPLDMDDFDNLQNLQFICASGDSAKLFVLYGSY